MKPGARTATCASNAIFCKNVGHPLRTPIERFEWVHAMRNDPSIAMLCENLPVSTSGFYDWDARRSAPDPRALEDLALADETFAIHSLSRQTYGAPRIALELRDRGGRHGRNRIARLMRQKHIFGRQKGRHRVQTTDSKLDQPIAPDRLALAPPTSAPDPIWVDDITYIQTGEGWLYLVGVLDLHSRRIVGWAMSPTIDSALVLAALSMGPCIAPRRPDSSSTPTAASGTPPGQLLPQRLHGKLLEHPRTGAGLPREVHQPATRQVRDLRLHRSLLQPPAPPHLPRRLFTRPLRTQKQPT